MHENLCSKLNYLARLLLSKVNEETSSYGVTQGQLPVLCCLNDKEGQTQSELCKNIQVEQPTMANTLRRMERDGLICKTPSEHDGRQSQIFISSEVRPLLESLQAKRDEVISWMLRDMSVEERDTFKRLIDKAVKSLDERPRQAERKKE
ncbi:Transcriptional regulator, MarR family [Citrifermentans bremense]|uniref:Transcriptional regulator, MarR family n=1 Tax=Citrifermentans bremense TaxID=60035 RepID=A0A6S6LV34_9BACT|nr:MarR family transcriptional regulator [Citrifermentans bremense]BCG45762.1 Transcriptional regulator, MarR family [Citrifermentans bremense]